MKTTNLTTITIGETDNLQYLHSQNDCIKERFFDFQRFTEWLNQISLKEIREKWKKDKELKREENRKKLEEAQQKARDFKDYQRRSNLGLLTPEEVAERDRKKAERYEKYVKKV